MDIKLLKRYMNICEELGVKATLQGAAQFKKVFK